MSSLLFLFIDGVGLGRPDATRNPFVTAATPFLCETLGSRLTDEVGESDGTAVVRRLDATLGTAGLPQSATGQGTLLTGLNCAEVMGGHYGPWPGPTIKRLLAQRSLFSDVLAMGGSALLANAYPPGYFEAISSGKARANVPAFAAGAAGLPLAGLEAYRSGQAIAADLTGGHFGALDSSLPRYRPEGAGARLAGLAATVDFTFFDFWLSDRIGHRGGFTEAVGLVEDLDRFIAGVAAGSEGITVLITSDHGNLEDKGTRTHTRAPVPLIALGPDRRAFAACTTLLDVAPAVRGLLA